MSHISRSFVIFLFLCAGLSACATATPLSTTTPFSTETPTPTPLALTATETPTSTPEPTAVPEATVVQKEITFKLTDGTSLPLMCFLKNLPENTTQAEKESVDKKLLETVLQYFVDLGVDWGNGNYDDSGASDEYYEFTRRLNMIPGKESGNGIPVRARGAEYEEFFGMLLMSIPYEGKSISLLAVKNPDKSFPYHDVCAEIDPQIVSSLILNQQINIPKKPSE